MEIASLLATLWSFVTRALGQSAKVEGDVSKSVVIGQARDVTVIQASENAALRLPETACSDPPIEVQARSEQTYLYFLIRNLGPTATFQVQVDSVAGLAPREDTRPFTTPYFAPWLGPAEAINKIDNWADRRDRELRRGATGTVALISCRGKDEAGQRLYELWCADAPHGWEWAHDDGGPIIEATFVISVISPDSPPLTHTYKMKAEAGIGMRLELLKEPAP